MSEERKDITPSKDQVKNPYDRKTVREGSIVVADLSVKRMSIPSEQGQINEALTNIPVEIKEPK